MPLHKTHTVNVVSLVAILCAFSFLGCSKNSDVTELHVKSAAAGERDVAIRTAFADPVTKTFTDTTGKMTTAVVYNIHVAN